MSATSVKPSVETATPRHSIPTGSTDFEATSGSVVGGLTRSADTVQAKGSDIRVSRQEDFWAALMKNKGTVNATTGIVKCVFSEGKGKSWIYESPTFRLDTGTVSQIRATALVNEPIEGLITNILYAPSTGFIVVSVAGLDTTARTIVQSSGLLNSTDRLQGVAPLIESKFAEAAALAGKEWFDDGVESEFSRALSMLLHTYNEAAIAPVETFLTSPSTNVEVAVEAAHWLGKVDHPSSHRYRKTLLERVLTKAPSARLRHGAAAGLADMDDPSSLAVVIEARDRESNRRLRQYLQLVVEQLENTRACLSS